MAAPATNVIPSPSSADYAGAITPSDSANIAATRGLWIGGAGNVTVKMAGDNLSVLFTGVPAGSVLPIRVTGVFATGTTATSIVGMW